MHRIEVEPDVLLATGRRQQELADRVHELAKRLSSAASEAAAAAGDDDGASAALEVAGVSLVASLRSIADSVSGLATNTDTAARAYTETDEGAMPGGP